MALHKAFIEDSKEVAGFLYVDLPNAEGADGIVRRAKKVLQDGAKNLARSRSYSWALLEQRVSGASGGIHQPGDSDDTLHAFIDMAGPLVREQAVSLRPSRGLTEELFEPLRRIDQRGVLAHAVTSTGPVTNALVAHAAVGIAEFIGHDIDQARVLIDAPLNALAQLAHSVDTAGGIIVGIQTESDVFVTKSGINAKNLVAALNVRGVDPQEAIRKLAEYEKWSSGTAEEFWATSCEVAFIGSKMGCLDHDLATTMQTNVVIPVAPLPYTARALATLVAKDVKVIPDFIVLTAELAPYLAVDDRPEPTDLRPMIGEDQLQMFNIEAKNKIEGILDSCLHHSDGTFIGAALEAERFLSTWQEELPFGRPLA